MSKPKSSPAPSTDLPNEDRVPVPPATGKGSRGPRKAKVTQPAWYRADIGDTFRLIEADSPEDVAALIVTVTPATPQDFVQAGKDGVALESKPTPTAE